mgnify:CR=1 FL=1
MSKKNWFFFVHLGRGNHAFVRGNGYHKFENIKRTKPWKHTKSVVSELGTSEADTISTIYNSRIIHDFLFDDPDKNLMLISCF